MTAANNMINRVSPSAIERIRNCGLAEYRRRLGAVNRPSRPEASNPAARLGNAAHRVLEWVARNPDIVRSADNSGSVVRARWVSEVEAEESAAQRAGERWGNDSERWPRFAFIEAGLMVDGPLLAAEVGDLAPEKRLTERHLSSGDELFFGSADLILVDEDGCRVIDHKAGAVIDDDIQPGSRYYDQLLLYSAMARDSGLNPKRAELRPIGGAPYEFRILDSMLEDVEFRASNTLKEFNEHVSSGRVIQLAYPSEQSCQWCPFLGDCPAVWEGAEVEFGDLAVVEGEVLQVQDSRRSVALRLESGDQTIQVVGLPMSTAVEVGSRVRVVGVRRTGDASFKGRPGQSSVAISAGNWQPPAQ